MNRLTLIIGVLLAFTMSGCIGWYDRMSHLTEKELEWINCYEVGDTILFYSDGCNPDTLVVRSKSIENTLNPFYIHFLDNMPGNYYNASAVYYFYIKSREDSIEGSLQIDKLAGINVIEWTPFLDSRFPKRMEYWESWDEGSSYNQDDRVKIESFFLGRKKLGNCIIMDDSNSRLSKHYKRENPIASFVFNRDYGLIYYRYADGTEFARKFE